MRSSAEKFAILAAVVTLAVVGYYVVVLWATEREPDVTPSVARTDGDAEASRATVDEASLGARESEGVDESAVRVTDKVAPVTRGELVIALVTETGRAVVGATVHVGERDPITTKQRESRVELPGGRYPIFVDLPRGMRRDYCLEPRDTNVVVIDAREVRYERRVVRKGTVEFVFDTTIREKAGCTLIFRSETGGTPWREGVSGPATRYRARLAPGRWRVRALFSKEARRIADEATLVEVAPGSSQIVKIVTRPMTTWFRGVVVDDLGEPVPGLRLRFEWRPEDGLRFTPRIESTRTDDKGRYAIQGPSVPAYVRLILDQYRTENYVGETGARSVEPDTEARLVVHRGFAIRVRVIPAPPRSFGRVSVRHEKTAQVVTRPVDHRGVGLVRHLRPGKNLVTLVHNGGVLRKTVVLGEGEDAPRIVEVEFDATKQKSPRQKPDQPRGRR